MPTKAAMKRFSLDGRIVLHVHSYMSNERFEIHIQFIPHINKNTNRHRSEYAKSTAALNSIPSLGPQTKTLLDIISQSSLCIFEKQWKLSMLGNVCF